MAKIDCPSCGKSVDEDMLFCPYCFNEFTTQEKDEEELEEEFEKEDKESEIEKELEAKKIRDRPKTDFLGEDKGPLIDGRYSIVDPFHFTCSRAIYKVEDVSEPGTYYSIREFLILSEDPSKMNEIIESFEETAEIFVHLSHPFLSRIVDYFSEDNYLFLVYEFAEGKSTLDFINDFHSRIRQGIPEGLLVDWTLKLCDLLEYLHYQRNPVYCIDFKPSYLIVSPEADKITYINIGAPYILDAIGTVETDGSVYIDSLKEEYKSPQRDIWCIGALIYFLISGKDIQKLISIPVAPINQIRPDLSIGFQEILTKALGKNQLSFYSDVRTLKRELLDKCKPRPISSYDFYYEYKGIDLSGYNWDAYLGSNSRTNSVGKGPRIPMKQAWSSKTKDGTKVALSPYDDNILLSFSDGDLFLLGSESGKIKWHYKQSETINTPIIYNGVVYESSASSQAIIAIRIGKGAPQWEAPVEGIVMSSPCIREDMIYQITYEGNILAIEIDEGELFWCEPLEVRIISSPALEGASLYIGALNGIVYAINLEDRDFLWQFDTEGSISTAPTLYEKYLFVGNHEGYLFCIERENGDLAWEYDVKGSVTQEVRAINGMVFCVTQKGLFFCFDPLEGETLWKVNLGQTFEFPFAVTNNKIYMLLPDNKIFCFDAFTGKLIDKAKLDEKIISPPLIFNGALYVVTQSGCLVSYR